MKGRKETSSNQLRNYQEAKNSNVAVDQSALCMCQYILFLRRKSKKKLLKTFSYPISVQISTTFFPSRTPLCGYEDTPAELSVAQTAPNSPESRASWRRHRPSEAILLSQAQYVAFPLPFNTKFGGKIEEKRDVFFTSSRVSNRAARATKNHVALFGDNSAETWLEDSLYH